MLRYIPLALAFVAIAGVAVFDGLLNHRWTPNTEAADYGRRIELLPKNIGDWEGKDLDNVDDEILRVTGAADGHISRGYVNKKTNEIVRVWLIVGPFKHIVRHTPDICYPSQDYHMEQRAATNYTFGIEGEAEDKFLTASFEKSRGLIRERVFWAWFMPDETGEVLWQGSPNKDNNREKFAGTNALFKLYFTCQQAEEDTKLSDTAAHKFAKECLPVLNELIRQGPLPESEAATPPAPADK